MRKAKIIRGNSKSRPESKYNKRQIGQLVYELYNPSDEQIGVLERELRWKTNKMSVRIEVNRDILVWALSRASYKQEEIDSRFPQIKFWLSGQKKPTIKQLADFSSKTHLPFGYLFLDKPLEEKNPIPYFRTEGESKISLNVLDTIKLLQNRQVWLRSYLQENEYRPQSFVGRFKNDNDHKIIAEDIRKVFQLSENWATGFRTWSKALEYLGNRTEEVGIIAVFNSVVGNNTHRKIEVEECRGFVLVDDYAPFMFVNGADAKSAQMFTIAHELAHIWIGLSAGFDLRRMLPANNTKERLCDKVAAEFLVPEKLFNTAWNKLQDFNRLSQYFRVSPIVVARRALDLGKIQREAFFRFYSEYQKKEYTKKKETGFADFYALQKKRLGLKFATSVHQAVGEGKLLYRDAYHLTGLFGESYQKFVGSHLP